MTKNPEKVIQTAHEINKVIDKNSLEIYSKKLYNALEIDDRDNFIRVLLDLSNSSSILIDLIYDLLENFEQNKTLAIIFVNELAD